MDRTLSLSLVIGAAVSGSLGAAVGRTVSEVGRVGEAVKNSEGEQRQALARSAEAQRRVAQVEAYRKLGRDALEAGRAHRAAQGDVERLARAMGDGSNATAAQGAELDRARRTVERTAAAVDGKKRRLNELRRELDAAGIDTADLGREQRRLAGEIDKAEREAKQAGAAIEAMGQKAERAAKRVEIGQTLKSQALQVGAFAASMVPVVGAAGRMENALLRYAQVAGLTDEQVAATRANLRTLATETNVTAEQLLAGLEILVGKGMDPSKAMEMMRTVGRAATATGGTIEDMAGLAFTLANNMRVAPAEIGRVLDAMAQSAADGGFELKSMAALFPQLTAAAGEAGLKMQGLEGAASLAAALQIALPGSGGAEQAANNFANFLNKVTAPETVERFKKQGVDLKEALADGLTRGENPVETMLRLIQEIAQGDEFKLGELFGDAQVLAFIRPMIAQMENYQRIKASAMASQGRVDKDFEAMSKGFSQATQSLNVAWSNLTDSVGRSLLPILTPLAGAAATVVGSVAELAERFPLVTGAAVLLFGAGSAVATALTGLRLAATFLPGPLGAIAARLVGLTVASGGATAGLWAQARAAGAATLGYVRLGAAAVASGARVAGSALAAGVTTIGGALLSFARVAIPVVVGGMRALTVAFMTNPVGLVIGGIALAAGLFIANWERVGPFFRGLWDGIVGSAVAAFDTVMGVVGSAVDWIAGKLSFIGDAISAVGGLWSRVTGGEGPSPARVAAAAMIGATVATAPIAAPAATVPGPAVATGAVAPAPVQVGAVVRRAADEPAAQAAPTGAPVVLPAPVTVPSPIVTAPAVTVTPAAAPVVLPAPAPVQVGAVVRRAADEPAAQAAPTARQSPPAASVAGEGARLAAPRPEPIQPPAPNAPRPARQPDQTTINITMNVNAVNDPRALADMVMREIERRRRGALQDGAA